MNLHIAERRPYPDIAVGLAVFIVGLIEVNLAFVWVDTPELTVIAFLALLGAAVACYRLHPGLGLALAWVAGLIQISAQAGVMVTEFSVLLLAYGAARHGRGWVVWLSGLSIPAACAVVAYYFALHLYLLRAGFGAVLVQLPTAARAPSVPQLALTMTLGVVLLAAPWVVGLLLRITDTAQRNRIERVRAEQEAARAQEIAEVRAGQARLARDVHDVVGHSLTVILAQADSAQFMPDSDIEKIRAAMRNIAQSARRSLGDVRQVLSSTGDAQVVGEHLGELDTLVEGVRSAGNDVQDQVSGAPRPLPPELEVVAFRVLQEMLTNALKHGARGATIAVDRSWGRDQLRIEVRNVAAATSSAWESAHGLGVPGMRRRLESVGGWLDVRSTMSPHGPIFTATAWVPARPGVAAQPRPVPQPRPAA